MICVIVWGAWREGDEVYWVCWAMFGGGLMLVFVMLNLVCQGNLCFCLVDRFGLKWNMGGERKLPESQFYSVMRIVGSEIIAPSRPLHVSDIHNVINMWIMRVLAYL